MNQSKQRKIQVEQKKGGEIFDVLALDYFIYECYRLQLTRLKHTFVLAYAYLKLLFRPARFVRKLISLSWAGYEPRAEFEFEQTSKTNTHSDETTKSRFNILKININAYY